MAWSVVEKQCPRASMMTIRKSFDIGGMSLEGAKQQSDREIPRQASEAAAWAALQNWDPSFHQDLQQPCRAAHSYPQSFISYDHFQPIEYSSISSTTSGKAHSLFQGFTSQ